MKKTYNAKRGFRLSFDDWSIYLIAGVVTISILAGLVWLRSDSRAIRNAFDEGVEAMETENMDQIASLMSDQYLDDLGYSRADVLLMARDVMNSLEAINITVEKVEVNKKNREANLDVQFKVVATIEGQRGYLAGNPQHAETIRIRMRKEKDAWKIVKIDYPRIHGRPKETGV